MFYPCKLLYFHFTSTIWHCTHLLGSKWMQGTWNRCGSSTRQLDEFLWVGQMDGFNWFIVDYTVIINYNWWLDGWEKIEKEIEFSLHQDMPSQSFGTLAKGSITTRWIWPVLWLNQENFSLRHLGCIEQPRIWVSDISYHVFVYEIWVLVPSRQQNHDWLFLFPSSYRWRAKIHILYTQKMWQYEIEY